MTTIPEAATSAALAVLEAEYGDLLRYSDMQDAIAAALPHLTPAPQAEGDVREVEELVERSSLGTPEAKAARESTPIDVAQEIVRRSNEQRTAMSPTDLTVLDMGVLRELAEDGKLVRANIFLPVLDEVERRRDEAPSLKADRDAALAAVERGRDAVLAMDQESIEAGLLEPGWSSLEASRILRALGGVDHG